MDENFSNNLQNVNLDDIKTMCNDKDSDNIKTNCGASNDILSMNPIRNIPKDNIDSKVQQTKQYIAPAKALPPGTIINSTYQIVRKIAQGGMGVVYEALDLTIQRRVAIKMILASFGESKYQTVLQRFINEINATAQLSHENIVHIYSSGFYQKQPYLVMEYIEGQSINQYVAQNCLSDWKKIAELIYKIAKGLDYIHNHNFLHRDIKPANILVTEDGEPILIDFGVVKDKNLAIEFTRQGKLLGTLQYMPIEQALGNNKEVDCRSDIYSLGIVLYELLTQQPAYSGNNHVVFKKILHEEPIQPRKINPEIPIELQRITLHAIAKEKNNRYKSAASFAQALGNYLYPEEIEAPLEDKKIQWHFSAGWNFIKRHQYLKKLDLSKQRKKRLVRIEKEDSFLKKILWSIILLIAILSLIIFAYYHFFIEKNYVIFQKENAEKIDNFTYDHTIKYKYIKDTLSEFDVYNYNLIPAMSFIYIPELRYLLATEDCNQSIWLRVMGTKPWEGELQQAKKDILCDYYNVLPGTIKNNSQYKDNQDSIAPDKPAIWIDKYDCQEFCHRTHLTLMTKAQWEHAKKFQPFKNLTKYYYHYGNLTNIKPFKMLIENYHYGINIKPFKMLIENYHYGINIKPCRMLIENYHYGINIKPDIKPYETDNITTFRCAYLIDSAQKEISSIPPIQKPKEIQGFTFLGIKRFSLEQEAKSISQYMHKKSHIIFSLVTQEQDNFLMSVEPCHYKNWDYIMKTEIQKEYDPSNETAGIDVTLKECNNFLEKSGLSLPTYSQWEYTCTKRIEQSFNKFGIRIFESENMCFVKKENQVCFGIKNQTYENEQEVTTGSISDYEESQRAYLRLVYNLQ